MSRFAESVAEIPMAAKSIEDLAEQILPKLLQKAQVRLLHPKSSANCHTKELDQTGKKKTRLPKCSQNTQPKTKQDVGSQ